LAQILPDILSWVQFWRIGRQEQDREVARDVQGNGLMPARAIHDDNAMGSGGDGCADLLEMLLHGLGVGVGHHQGRALIASWADRTEDIGVLVALIGGLAWTRTFCSPLVDLAVLLANPCFILEPDFNGLVGGDVFQAFCQRFREVFLKASIVSRFCLGCRGRALT